MNVPQTDFDVAIVGAGPVGLACAGWLLQHWAGLAHRIAVFDAKPLEASAHDPRVLALSEATRLRLKPLGFPAQATPIQHIHVSEQGRFGQVRMQAEDLHLPALGWTVRYGDLTHVLSEPLVSSGVQMFRPVAVKTNLTPSPQRGVEVLALEDGRQFTTRLRIDAEGGLFGAEQTRDQHVDFHQAALISEVHADVEPRMLKANNTLAFERFTVNGPLALLPISTDRQRYALVWCASPSEVKRRLDMPEADCLRELNALLGRRVRVRGLGAMQSFPVGMSWRDDLVQGGRVVVGNAAQILHPVAGQGLNLGLRDALQLSQAISPALMQKAPEHLGAVLAQYAQARRLDRMTTLRATQWMVKGFSTSNPWFIAGRQLALNVMEYTPGLRHQFANLMLFGLMA